MKDLVIDLCCELFLTQTWHSQKDEKTAFTNTKIPQPLQIMYNIVYTYNVHILQ